MHLVLWHFFCQAGLLAGILITAPDAWGSVIPAVQPEMDAANPDVQAAEPAIELVAAPIQAAAASMGTARKMGGHQAVAPGDDMMMAAGLDIVF